MTLEWHANFLIFRCISQGAVRETKPDFRHMFEGGPRTGIASSARHLQALVRERPILF
jgi:hypothetical protein